MRRVTRAADVFFIVNDRVDVALACRADGVHLGQSDLPVDVARALVPSEFIIGVSVSHAAEAVQAVQEGADYVAASPVFLTASKHDAGLVVELPESSRLGRRWTSLSSLSAVSD